MEKKIEICSVALQLLGHSPISSFEEPGAGALLSKNLYESTYRDFLSSTDWNFSKKYMHLNRISGETNHPNFKYMFQLPVDFLRLSKTVPVADYSIMEDKILTNEPDIFIEYSYRVKEEYLPAYAIKAMHYLMAATLSVPLTVDVKKAEYYTQQYQMQKITAMSIDAQNDPSEGWASTPILDVRFG